ncbi:transglycosylase domain-containing protein [Caldinitratiruptor microaerophilus]|uniref:Penicillin-binding protein 1A n=1 Tax=Caldinitratiruptor microaerophilus TaxID=671077 RepID=A0AA35CQ67_9FIRM|nr:PBP1A family penicillin-binding protein [Caldinitratiruptor microaerophilus]BDG61810.1 penicillin-binding protein 1A [Caldinitratiruptor microaerophilus]
MGGPAGHKRRRWGRLGVAALVLLLLVLAVLAAGAVTVAAAVALTPLPPPELPRATEFYDVKGRLIGRRFHQNRVEVPLTELPPYLVQAVLAAEDERFYQHRGIDVRGLLRAAYRNLRARRVVEGGSTITQQLARNLYLGRERTVARKLREAVYALKLETVYSKDEILELYLNTIYLGQGAYGVEVAAQTYFSKHARELTLPEAALLAGLPRGPELYNPILHPEAAEARRAEVLDRMVATGVLPPAQATAARQAPLGVRPPPPAPAGVDFFLDHVIDEIRRSYPAIADRLPQGGYRIDTTLDLDVQAAAARALADGLPAPVPDARGVPQPQAALVALDPRTGAIRAMIGGRDYRTSSFNRAVQAPRQPGSAFKPFLYATLLSTRYYTAASTQVCEPVQFPGGAGRPPWEPADFDPRQPYHNRPLGVREAIRVSDNVVAARWMDALGPERVIDTARRLGITSPLRPDLTLALGTSEVTVLEMARAFAAFANGGLRVDPHAVVRITDPTGRVLAEPSHPPARVLEEGVAYILTDLMREVVRPGGTAGHVAPILGGRPAAGKTGTTDEARDAWMVGYTPDLVAAVWVGSDDPGAAPGRLTGPRVAAPIWANFLSRALAGRPPTPFVPPEGVVTARICADSGLLAVPGCPAADELFLSGTEPTTYDPRWLGTPPPMPGEPVVPGEPIVPPEPVPPGRPGAPEPVP